MTKLQKLSRDTSNEALNLSLLLARAKAAHDSLQNDYFNKGGADHSGEAGMMLIAYYDSAATFSDIVGDYLAQASKAMQTIEGLTRQLHAETAERKEARVA